MTLTKDDLQSIRGIVHEEVTTIVGKKIEASEKRLVAEMDRRFTEQSKSRGQHFIDLKLLMETNYVNREEFEERYNELQNEVDDLRKQVSELQRKIVTS